MMEWVNDRSIYGCKPIWLIGRWQINRNLTEAKSRLGEQNLEERKRSHPLKRETLKMTPPFSLCLPLCCANKWSQVESQYKEATLALEPSSLFWLWQVSCNQHIRLSARVKNRNVVSSFSPVFWLSKHRPWATARDS